MNLTEFQNNLLGQIEALSKEGFDKDEIARLTGKTLALAGSLAKPGPGQEFFCKGNFLFDKFARFLKAKANIKRIYGHLHIYQSGIYEPATAALEAAMIKHIPGLSASKRLEVRKYLELLELANTEPADARYIAFNNGVYDIAEAKLLPFSPGRIITNKIPWNYDPAAYSKTADIVLNRLSCNDCQIRALLEEMIGYCFYRRNELGKAFILIGDKANGKSTFLSLLQSLLGEANISALDLAELSDRFKPAALCGKLANIGDDIGDKFVCNASIFRKLVTGDRVAVEKKGQDPFEFNNYSKFLFSANTIPQIKDPTGAVQRRLVIIPFNASFTKTLPDGRENPNYDPYIKYKLRESGVMEYLLLLGLKGLKRLLDNRAFTASAKVEKELYSYKVQNDSVLAFLEECQAESYQIIGKPTREVYERYVKFCEEEKRQLVHSNLFSKKVCNELALQTIPKKVNSRLHRIFCEPTQVTGVTPELQQKENCVTVETHKLQNVKSLVTPVTPEMSIKV
jgi:putative DNA primase/helicase